MSIYQDILNWSQGRQAFVQDALRRLITSTILTQTDIDELVQLVKRECGDRSITLNPIPLESTHIFGASLPTDDSCQLKRPVSDL